MEDELESLKKIRRVEAPPFLFTRIAGRIESLQPVSTPWKLAFVSSLVLVLGLNVTIAIMSASGDNRLSGVVSAMHISTSNSLYDE